MVTTQNKFGYDGGRGLDEGRARGAEEGLCLISHPHLLSQVFTPLLLGWHTALSVWCSHLGVPGLALTQGSIPKGLS